MTASMAGLIGMAFLGYTMWTEADRVKRNRFRLLAQAQLTHRWLREDVQLVNDKWQIPFYSPNEMVDFKYYNHYFVAVYNRWKTKGKWQHSAVTK